MPISAEAISQNLQALFTSFYDIPHPFVELAYLPRTSPSIAISDSDRERALREFTRYWQHPALGTFLLGPDQESKDILSLRSVFPELIADYLSKQGIEFNPSTQRVILCPIDTFYYNPFEAEYYDLAGVYAVSITIVSRLRVIRTKEIAITKITIIFDTRRNCLLPLYDEKGEFANNELVRLIERVITEDSLDLPPNPYSLAKAAAAETAGACCEDQENIAVKADSPFVREPRQTPFVTEFVVAAPADKSTFSITREAKGRPAVAAAATAGAGAGATLFSLPRRPFFTRREAFLSPRQQEERAPSAEAKGMPAITPVADLKETPPAPLPPSITLAQVVVAAETKVMAVVAAASLQPPLQIQRPASRTPSPTPASPSPCLTALFSTGDKPSPVTMQLQNAGQRNIGPSRSPIYRRGDLPFITLGSTSPSPDMLPPPLPGIVEVQERPPSPKG